MIYYIVYVYDFKSKWLFFAKKCRTGTARACGFLWESAFCTPRPVHSVSCGTNSTKVPDSRALLCSLKRDKTWQHLDSGLQLDFGLKKHRARSLELFVKSHQSNPEVRWIPSTPITTCWSWGCWSPPQWNPMSYRRVPIGYQIYQIYQIYQWANPWAASWVRLTASGNSSPLTRRTGQRMIIEDTTRMGCPMNSNILRICLYLRHSALQALKVWQHGHIMPYNATHHARLETCWKPKHANICKHYVPSSIHVFNNIHVHTGKLHMLNAQRTSLPSWQSPRLPCRVVDHSAIPKDFCRIWWGLWHCSLYWSRGSVTMLQHTACIPPKKRKELACTPNPQSPQTCPSVGKRTDLKQKPIFKAQSHVKTRPL